MAVLPLCLPVKCCTPQAGKKKKKRENSWIRRDNVLTESPVCKCLFCNNLCETAPAAPHRAILL